MLLAQNKAAMVTRLVSASLTTLLCKFKAAQLLFNVESLLD